MVDKQDMLNRVENISERLEKLKQWTEEAQNMLQDAPADLSKQLNTMYARIGQVFQMLNFVLAEIDRIKASINMIKFELGYYDENNKGGRND